MSSRLTTALVLPATLAIGIVLGLVISGTLAQQRREQAEGIRAPGGFVRHMERVIEPTDEAQRAVLIPLLEAADARNRQIIRDAESEIAAALQAFADEVGGTLTDAQRERLAREVARARPLGPPPSGPLPPDGGPPPSAGPAGGPPGPVPGGSGSERRPPPGGG